MRECHFWIDLAQARAGEIVITVVCRSTEDQKNFLLEALTVGNGIEVENLTAHDLDEHELPFEVDGNHLFVFAPTVCFSYVLRTGYQVCVGADKKQEFIYPFANSDEIFLGTGALIHPVQLEEWDVRMTLLNPPEGFRVFSNLVTEADCMAAHKLSGFFLYLSPESPAAVYTYQYDNGTVLTLQLCVQQGKTLPLAPDELFDLIGIWLLFLETHVSSYDRVETVNILILQAPPDFEALAGGKSFATGENMRGGIVCYAPNDPAYLHRLFGYDDYRTFLFDGLIHEIGHFYTSSDAKPGKAFLYPSDSCTPADRMLIGEALNGYLHRQFLARFHHNNMQHFFSDSLARWLTQQQTQQRRSFHLDWFLLDVYLRTTRQVSLWHLLQAMVQTQQSINRPFDSVGRVIDAVEHILSGTLPELYQIILREGVKDFDYPTQITAALEKLGYRLIESAESYKITPAGDGITPFELP